MSTHQRYEEKELLSRIAEGDERAFGQLYNVYQPLLATYIFRVSRSRELAEEYAHDVFLKIWTNRELLREVKHIKAYLGVLSRNYALNSIRSIVNERRKRELWMKEHTKEALSQADDLLEERDVYTVLDAAIERLPAQQKKVYMLARHERLTYAQIAEQLGLGAGTVKRHLHLATQSITRYILAEFPPSQRQLLVLFLAARILQ